MQYFGGKAGSGKRIAEILNASGRPQIIDAFCGALNVIRHCVGRRYANDACTPLITMWRKAQLGWVPPKTLSKAQYDKLNATRDPNDPMTAFVLFGVSFGGKWAGGYAKDRPQQRYAECAHNGIIKKIRDCAGVVFSNLDYTKLDIPRASTLYCDPPYAMTTSYGAVTPFSHTEFWEWCDVQASKGVKVFVSEKTAPKWWKIVETSQAVQGGRLTPGKTPLVDYLWTRHV